jgi:hypothetical protein
MLDRGTLSLSIPNGACSADDMAAYRRHDVRHQQHIGTVDIRLEPVGDIIAQHKPAAIWPPSSAVAPSISSSMGHVNEAGNIAIVDAILPIPAPPSKWTARNQTAVVSKQSVDKRGNHRSARKNQQPAQQKHHDHNRREPILFAIPHKCKKFSNE